MTSRCRGCGLPKPIGKKLIWTSRGEVYPRHPGGERLLFLDASWARALAQHLKKANAEDLLQRLRGLRREHTKRKAKESIGRWAGFLLRRRVTGGHILQEILNELTFYGYGKLKIKEFKPRKLFRVKAIHAYDDFFLPSDLWGLWEGTQNVTSTMLLEKEEEGSYVLVLRTKEKVGEIHEALRKQNKRRELPPPVKEDEVISLCPKCHRPIYPGRMSWVKDKGILVDESTGRRFIVTPVASWALVFSTLKEEGPQILDSFKEELANSNRSHAGPGLGKDIKAFYRDYFLSLPFLGWGKPVRVARKPFVVEAELLGTPFPEILAADMRGRFGALEREDWTVEVKTAKDGRQRFLMGPSWDGPWTSLGAANIPPSHPGILLP